MMIIRDRVERFQSRSLFLNFVKMVRLTLGNYAMMELKILKVVKMTAPVLLMIGNAKEVLRPLLQLVL